MKEQEYIDVKQWLVDNEDKWEDEFTFKFLVPIEEVPPAVVEYVKHKELARKEMEEEIDQYVAFGLNDF